MSNVGNTAPGTPPRAPGSRPAVPPSTPPSNTLRAIAAAGDGGSLNPIKKKKRRKVKGSGRQRAPAPAPKNSGRSSKTKKYTPCSQGVLDWARTYEGADISAEEMKQFKEMFTTKTNSGFVKPQKLTKQAMEDKSKFRTSVASAGFAQEGFYVPIIKGDVSNLRRYLFEDLLLSPDRPFVIAWSTNRDTPLSQSNKQGRADGKVLEMCCLQQKAPGYGGTTRSFNYDQSMHYIITGQLLETHELNLVKDGKKFHAARIDHEHQAKPQQRVGLQ